LLVYPPNHHRTYSACIFFIGSSWAEAFVNNKKIRVFPNGNFIHFEELSLGENQFSIEIDGSKNLLEIIYDPQVKIQGPEILEFYNSQDLERLGANQFDSKKSIKRICIDPGHGGMAIGSRSPKGIKEKDLNLKLALLLNASLEEEGFQTILTRDFDQDLSLANRVEISKNFDSDLFISIHHNAVPDHKNPLKETGVSAHYYHENSKDFSARLVKYLSENLSMNLNGLYKQNLYVLRENPKPVSVLLELGFLIHPLESELIIQEAYQAEVVKALITFIKDEQI
jgi:N-acetylmuramoyl-L-alanine amidase